MKFRRAPARSSMAAAVAAALVLVGTAVAATGQTRIFACFDGNSRRVITIDYSLRTVRIAQFCTREPMKAHFTDREISWEAADGCAPETDVLDRFTGQLTINQIVGPPLVYKCIEQKF